MKENKGVIVCVAIKTSTDVVYSLPLPARHHDVIRYMCEEMFFDRVGGDFTQGFLASPDGRFVDRKEALVIAKEANQLIRKTPPEDILFSEDLW